jgi:hypothetical protein
MSVGRILLHFFRVALNLFPGGCDPLSMDGKPLIPQTGDTVMFRKIILALSATAALGAAALAPTAASAWGHGHGGHGHHWRGGYGFGFYGPTYIASSPDCYRVRRVVDTAYGPRVRRILVCN